MRKSLTPLALHPGTPAARTVKAPAGSLRRELYAWVFVVYWLLKEKWCGEMGALNS